MKRRMFVLLGLCLAVALMAAGCLNPASKFPSKPVEIVVPFDPGGAVDTTIRLLTQYSAAKLGGSFVVVNKPGGGAVIGQTEVATAQPDGYKLLAATSSLVSNTITKTVTYTIDSFEPVIMYCFDPEVLIVPANSPFKNLKDVIEAGKARPLIHSTPGASTAHHIAGLIFTDMTGCRFDYVHTTGGSAQVLQLAGEHAEIGMGVYGSVQSLVEQGKLRIIAIASEKRVSNLPDVPTFKEQGVDLLYGAWRGVAAPKGTPKEIINKLHEALKAGFDNPEFQDKMAKAGYPTEYRGPEDFRRYIQNDYKDLKKIEHLLK